MSKAMKIWLIAAGALIFLGIIIFVAAMSIMGWTFMNLSTVEYEKNSYEINETFSNIIVNSSTAEIQILPSDDDKCRVECNDDKKAKHYATVKDDTLEIDVVNEKKWYDYISIGIGSWEEKITVYLPTMEYNSLCIKSSTSDVRVSENFTFKNIDISLSTGDAFCYANGIDNVNIKTSTGKIIVDNIFAGDVNLTTSVGNIVLSYVTCNNLISSGNTGDIELKNVIASEKIDINRSTGDVIFEDSDGAEIFVVTDTGDVEGSLLSQKVFVIRTDTGDVEVPDSIEGGRCEIKTDTGDVCINIHRN